MGDYIYYQGKKLKKGYTTGTCAAAASLAASRMLLDQEEVGQVELRVPSGDLLRLRVENQSFDKIKALCSVAKDGGDDIDATHGMDIFAKVRLREDNKILIDGGEGIGRVRKKGLKQEIGQAAINPVPLQMIEEAVRGVIGENMGADVLIYAPKGEEIARKTFNPRLGIEGGISILGTSGIVTPMSNESWKESISMELEQKKAYGLERIVLCPGGYGEDFIKENTRINPKYIVQMSNFVGYALLEAGRIGFKEVLLVGHFGKMIKLAGGIFSTHSKDADARNEIMIANLALMGAGLDVLKKVNQASTTEGQAEIVVREGLDDVYQILVGKIKARSEQRIHPSFPDLKIEAIAFLETDGILRSTKSLKDLEEVYK